MLPQTAVRFGWTSNIRIDVLSGLVVALALIPEAVGFSVIAGVDPKVGLYASVVIACVIAFAGGRPAMISAATAATAVLMGPLVKAHGLSYLFAATVLMGVIQIGCGPCRPGTRDAVRVAVGNDRLRQRPGHPDLDGPTAPDDRAPRRSLTA
ncbi:MAG: SulP family inorganic anion transporter [Caulobacteraceae bacterium]